jgi:hypothetical protein
MAPCEDGTQRSRPHTARSLRVGRASGSRQASQFDLWYLTIAGVPAPRRKPAPGCVIHKTRPTGPDAGQHGRLSGEILQPKGLSQGEQWRRRPNTSVRVLLFLRPLMEGPIHDRAKARDFAVGPQAVNRPASTTAAVCSRAANCQGIWGSAPNPRQALKCTIRQAREVDRAGAFRYNDREGTFDKTYILGGEP